MGCGRKKLWQNAFSSAGGTRLLSGQSARVWRSHSLVRARQAQPPPVDTKSL